MLTTDVTTTLGNVSIGLSKQLKDLLTSDLTDDIVNVAGTDKRVKIASVWGDGFPDIPTSTSGAMSSTSKNDYSTIYLNPADSQNYSCGVGNAYSEGMYVRSILVYVPATDYMGTDEDYLYSGNQGDLRIVTDVNIQAVHIHAYAFKENGVEMLPDDLNDVYVTNNKPTLRDNETLTTVTARGGCIYPAWLIVIDDKIAIWTGALCRVYDNYGNRSLNGNGNYNFYSFNGFNRMTVTSRMFDDENVRIYPHGVGIPIDYQYSNIADYKIRWSFRDRYPYYWSAPVNHETKAMYMDYVSRTGLYFAVGDKRYKPIISNGFVTGYTDDLTVKSDIDNWTNINAHNIPPTPPIPDPTDADDIDDMQLGNINFGTGFVKYYQCTTSDLDFVSDALSSQTEYTDLSRNIVSLKSFTLPTSNYIASTSAQKIKIGSLQIDRTVPKIIVSTSDYVIGSYTITGKFGSIDNPHFLDKSPYTQIELYIPFCGTITLPDTVMYKTIEVHLLADIFTGSCLGVVKCNGNIVAEKSGICGIDVPITSEDNALKSNALISGVLNSVPIAASAVSGVMTKNPVTVFNAVNAAISNTNNMRVAESANYTRVVGTTGSRTDNALPDTCFIKIYRPIVHIPDNYAHKYGKPCNKKLNLNSCTGFTQCFNPVINGNMTTVEKDKIISLLSSGVYL